MSYKIRAYWKVRNYVQSILKFTNFYILWSTQVAEFSYLIVARSFSKYFPCNWEIYIIFLKQMNVFRKFGIFFRAYIYIERERVWDTMVFRSLLEHDVSCLNGNLQPDSVIRSRTYNKWTLHICINFRGLTHSVLL